MTRRGGARVRVFGAKPSPFLVFCVPSAESGEDLAKNGGWWRFARSVWGAKNLSFASIKSVKGGLKI